MRIVALNELKPREKFRFPADIEKRLGIRGNCNISVKRTKNVTQIRKTYTEKVFWVEYLKKGISIKNFKTGECIEFPHRVLVIAKEKNFYPLT